MRVTALLLAVAFILTGCTFVKPPSKFPEETMSNSTYKRMAVIYERNKVKIDSVLDRREVEAEISGRAGLKAFALQAVTSTAGGVIGKSAATAQVLGRALDLAGNTVFAVKGNKLWAVAVDYFNPEVKTDRCRFSAKFHLPEGMERGKVGRWPFYRDQFYDFVELKFHAFDWRFDYLKDKVPVDYDRNEKENVIHLYVLRWKPMRDRFFWAEAPYLLGVAEVRIKGKLAGRYVLEGITGSAIFSRDLKMIIKKETIIIDLFSYVQNHCIKKEKVAEK
ncbi:MAG: hypothetical protein Q9M89_01635 [Persephonella sp.]|nr:hypothetical protein [Persephonella sp.]